MRDRAYLEHYAAEDRHWWFRGRWAVIEALLARAGLPERPRILDAGCGTGGNLARYSRLGEAIGVDPSPDAVRLCRGRGLGSVREAGIEELPFAEASFDLIAATDVLEHVADEGRALRELRRTAAPGGVLLLTVPAYMWMWSREDEYLHHHRRYTRRRLRAAAQAAGWAPQVVTYFNSTLLPAIALFRLLGGQSRRRRSELELTPRLLNRPLSVPMRVEAALIRAGLALPAGASVGLVCRNPG